jgi:hypothetical protein
MPPRDALERMPINQAALHMLHCRIELRRKVQASMQMKAADRAKLPLCRVWNGSNKISL